MSAATVEFVNTRLFPIEQSVTGVTSGLAKLEEVVEEFKLQLMTRDADLQAAERRFEENSAKFDKLERDIRSEVSEETGEKTWRSPGNILRNPALRNVEPYSGDHRKYSKWKSKLRGFYFVRMKIIVSC